MVLQFSRPAATGGVAAALLLVGALAAPAAQAGDQPVADVVDQAVVAGASVVTMTPVRVLTDRAVSPDTVECLPLAGVHGISAAATGVVVNVTSVSPDGPGYAVVFPGTNGEAEPAMPATSTVNFEPGRDVASSTFVALGPDGDLCYATKGAERSGLILDVSGYVEEGSGVVVNGPERLLDTRTAGSGGALVPREARALDVAEKLGVPADAESVILNVTVTGVAALGNLRVYPGGAVTDTSVVNYAPGLDKANTTVVALSDLGSVSLFSDSTQPVHVVVDVLGWTEAGGSHVGVDPTRVLDTREDALDAPAAPMEGGFVYSLQLGEVVPANATAIVLNVTAIHPSTDGNLRVYPGQAEGVEPPETSSINYIAGRDIPNLVVVGLPQDGYVDFYSDQPEGGTVDLAVDVVGYITDITG